MTTTRKLVGAPIKRKEDPRLITGEGHYTDDLQPRRVAYMAVLRSPHAHARIVGVDTSGLRGRPDILAVLTGADVRERCAGPLPLHAVGEGMNLVRRWAIAQEQVNFVGDTVAAVVATSRAVAIDALGAIEVEYEILPPVVDPEEALKPGAPLVHGDLGTNLCLTSSRKGGDVDGAFRDADGVVSLRMVHPRIVGNSMETRAVVAEYQRSTDNLTLWLTTQGAHLERTDIAEVLGMPENRVRVIVEDMGGGYGPKMHVYPETIIAALFAQDLDRPVKWVEDRQEHHLCTTQARGQVQYVEAAYSNDGTLLGLRLKLYNDLGAYSDGTSHLYAGAITAPLAQGTYRVRGIEWENTTVYTNKVPLGPYRAYGRPEASMMSERVIDMIAARLNMDPAEVRRKNFIPKGEFPYQTPGGLEYDSGDYERTMDKALHLAGYSQLREEQARLREGGVLMGIGIASPTERSGGSGLDDPLSAFPGYESATVRIDPMGGATLLTGSSPHGQGIQTTFAQILCDELGIPFEDVEVLYGDTAIIPRGVGTFGSRSIQLGGTAVVNAGQQVLEKAKRVAAALLNTEAGHVVLENGVFFAEDIPDRQVTWAEVGKEAHEGRVTPRDVGRGLEATTFWESPSRTYPYSVNVVAVLVDPDTGEIKITKYIAVDDCGAVINPLIVEGQVHGALAQGIGPALFEEAIYDEAGQMVTGSFMDYAMPLAEEFPEFILDRTETRTPHNPLGAKGCGEMGTMAAPPALVNAVVDALSHLGVTHIDIPLTSEKVWRALREAAR